MTSEPGELIHGIASVVVAELARLKGLLEPLDLDRSWTDEWSIAAAGLFGPSGVVGFVAGAIIGSDEVEDVGPVARERAA